MAQVSTGCSPLFHFALLLGAATSVGACVDSPSEPSSSPPPLLADAGSGRITSLGTPVRLEALPSDGDGAVTYAWSLMPPSGSNAQLSSTSGVSTELTPDVLGSYDIELVVSDGDHAAVDTVNVMALESHCDALQDLFPTPVSAATTPFSEVDDASIGVPFGDGFQFDFYGTSYDLVWVNTNGGMTFGDGEPFWDLAAVDVVFPAIAAFWGDMSPALAPHRPAQLYHESCPDRFILYYRDYQDLGEESWTNTATVTLLEDGTIIMDYGDVGSADILVGVMDGTHVSDQLLPVQDVYADYDASSGIILFDTHGAGSLHTGALSGRTLTFTPAAPTTISDGPPS